MTSHNLYFSSLRLHQSFEINFVKSSLRMVDFISGLLRDIMLSAQSYNQEIKVDNPLFLLGSSLDSLHDDFSTFTALN